ncbi:hypothetical protein KP509_01G020000 [Ceratopteris richardii]|uniref:Cysteine proteinase inhibitor n=1 Tax=Ceratopteris richardii TaxID=49495 RepID=A0A8T2VIN1_CERRI|nr:hypothetical protein KP509_01G020000 [Ceratopteris richardii]
MGTGGSCAVSAVLVLLFCLACSPASAILRQPGGRRAVPSHDISSASEIQRLAKFAVDEYNSIEGKNLRFVRLVSAEQQVVSGIMYYLVIEAETAQGDVRSYEAKVWVKLWEDFQSLEEFKSLEPTFHAQGGGLNI